MREYPLTEKQIEICDYLLKIKNKHIDQDYLWSKGYDTNVDLNFALKYLLDNKLISVADPVCLTDIGTKYLKTGIVKFFKDQRRDEFLNSVIVRTIAVWTGIIFSLVIGVSNCRQNQINKSDNIEYIKHSEIDSILNKKLLKNTDSPKDKFAIEKVERDSFNHNK
jgi:hypothetical protein